MNAADRWRAALSRSALTPDADPVRSLAALDQARVWLNSPPLTAADFSCRVVLVDFCTYTCVNWLRTLSYLRAWREKYGAHGLLLVGIHTPEFDFEHEVVNVRRAVESLGVDYPVAIDNDYAIWSSFDNQYWPALYFIDSEGQLRHHQFGEGDYDRSEAMIQMLLTETGANGFSPEFVRVDAAGVEAAADWNHLWSPENYLGSERTENFASPNGALLGISQLYAVPPDLALNSWALAGDWTVTRGAVVLNQAGGAIRYRFHARDLNLVMAPAANHVPFHVRIDGQPPGPAYGVDVDADGNGVLDAPRLYQLVRQPGPIADRTVEITFRTAGAHAYAFTFG